MSEFEVRMVTFDVEPHPDADRLEIARIRNTQYTSVVPKGVFYEVDNQALYIPDQAIVPDWILEELGLIGKLAGSKKNRVKPMNLRGVLSQGILYTPSQKAWELFDNYEWPEETEGAVLMIDLVKAGRPNPEWFLDWAPCLGITKWVPEVPLDMAGVQYAPDAIQSYTDINDFKKYPDLLEEGEHVIITEKIHGTCAIYHLAYGTLHVSSKGIAKKGLAIEPDEGNLYWKIADSYNIKDRLVLFGEPVITLFGEIYGVQDLKYGATKGEPKFRAFDIAINGQYVNYDRFVELCEMINIPMVPTLYDGPFHAHLLPDFAVGGETVTLHDSPVLGDRFMPLPENAPLHIREGVVVKPAHERRDFKHGRVIFKYVSPDYLNRKGDTTEYE